MKLLKILAHFRGRSSVMAWPHLSTIWSSEVLTREWRTVAPEGSQIWGEREGGGEGKRERKKGKGREEGERGGGREEEEEEREEERKEGEGDENELLC